MVKKNINEVITRKKGKGEFIACSIALVLLIGIGVSLGVELSTGGLSPLVAGGILGSVVPVSLVALLTIALLISKLNGDAPKCELKTIALAFAFIVTSALTGIGIAAVANAIFPGVMLATGSSALVGAIIGLIAPIAGLFVWAEAKEFIIDLVFSMEEWSQWEVFNGVTRVTYSSGRTYALSKENGVTYLEKVSTYVDECEYFPLTEMGNPQP